MENLPTIDNIHPKWRDQVLRMQREGSEEPYYKAITVIPHGGDDYYDSQYTSLFGALDVGFYKFKVPLNTSSPEHQSFIEHIRDQWSDYIDNIDDTLNNKLSQIRKQQGESIKTLDMLDDMLDISDEDDDFISDAIAFNRAEEMGEMGEGAKSLKEAAYLPELLKEIKPFNMSDHSADSKLRELMRPELAEISPGAALQKLWGFGGRDASLAIVRKHSSALNFYTKKLSVAQTVIAKVSQLSSDKYPHNSQENFELFCPTPAKNLTGVTIEETSRDGKTATKNRLWCKDNLHLKEQRFCILECDNEEISKRHQLGAILEVATFAPLVAIVDSGKKSLHAWFDWHGGINGGEKISRDDMFMFMSMCRKIFDVDRVAKDACRLFRMPNSIRSNGNKQKLVYADFDRDYSSNWNISGLQAWVRKHTEFSSAKCAYVNQQYYHCKFDGVWIPQKDSHMMDDLAMAGFAVKPLDGEIISASKRYLSEVRQKNKAFYAGRVAGYSSGLHYIASAGGNILVTHDSNFLKSKPCTHGHEHLPALKFFKTLLPDEDDFVAFCGWYLWWHKSLVAGEFWHSQFLVMLGDVNVGKSVTANIINEIVFGRHSDGSAFFANESTFNQNMIENEMILIDDDHKLPTRYEERVKFGEHIKSCLVSPSVLCHPKFGKAITLRPHWRAVMMGNLEDMNKLPPITDGARSSADKIILVKAHKAVIDGTRSEKTAQIEGVKKSLPFFIDWLYEKLDIPQHMRDVSGRYGIASHKNKELLRTVNEMSPQNDVCDLTLNLFDRAAMNRPEIVEAVEEDGLFETNIRDLFDFVHNNVMSEFERTTAKNLIRTPHTFKKLLADAAVNNDRIEVNTKINSYARTFDDPTNKKRVRQTVKIYRKKDD